ncbi:MAG: FGGY-family carbohydrate kinase [Eubacteriales bacterium]|nr:FGGY-family carbohydrate kinase [Eubacteriales bacterium]
MDYNKTQYIKDGNAVLGIEFGSTRIKAVLINEKGEVLAQGSHQWENQLSDNIWTYSVDAIWNGLRSCYADLSKCVQDTYNISLTKLSALGISGMMHGYMPFNKAGELLVPFRTWRNTITRQASDILTEKFTFNIPQRWSIAHLYQAVLNNEPHVSEISYFTTLAGYIHWKLTGRKVLGIGEASGMFPIDSRTKNYNQHMLSQFDALVGTHTSSYNNTIKWKINEILPEVLVSGNDAGTLTKEGALLLDPSGTLKAGCILCPPEGDAGTGMTATNSISVRTGNVSSGTSVFAMVVLEKPLSNVYTQIDMVTTPVGDDVAMVHCNNCTSDINAWASLFNEFAKALGTPVTTDELYTLLFNKALEGQPDCGGLMTYNYYSGEPVTGMAEGRPILIRRPDSTFSLANLMRTNLYSALAALKLGMDILTQKENVRLDSLLGHGGFYKTPKVGQQITAAALNVPVTVMPTASEGGAWGIAVLAAYSGYCRKCSANSDKFISLQQYLSSTIFADQKCFTIKPVESEVLAFNSFIEKYRAGLAVEQAATRYL